VKTFAFLRTLVALLAALVGCGSSTVEGQPSAAPSTSVATHSPSMDNSCSVQNEPTGSETATIIKPFTCSYGYTPQNGEVSIAACGFIKGVTELNANKLAELKTHRRHVPMEGPDGRFTIYVTDDMIALSWAKTHPRSIVVNQQQTGLVSDSPENIPSTSHLLFKDWTRGIEGLQICF
jgi:hypothetical protein